MQHPPAIAWRLRPVQAQGRGPSPLLPAWLDFGLQPARAERHRGLLAGASPLLLPEAPPRTPPAPRPRAGWSWARPWRGGRGSDSSSGDREGAGEVRAGVDEDGLEAGSEAELAGGVMPSRGVLARSQFLEPLDEDTAALHWAVLHPDLERDSL